MFKSTETLSAEKVSKEALGVESNSIIQKNDRISLKIFSNNGERLIDPNPELTNSENTKIKSENEPDYTIDINGNTQLPLLGTIHLESLTIKQAEEILQKEYSKYYKDPFVKISILNKRVIVLGALGGQVIPLENENIKVVEVLALAKGLPNDSKADNIRLIRDEKVFEIDLSTIEGYRNGNMLIQSGDIVYVEPIIRPVSEGLKDYYGLITLMVGLATLITVINNLN
jgi:polysaccharide export outer membrane protein